MGELEVRVRCPFCGCVFNVRTLKTVKCRKCGRSFEVYVLDRFGKVKKTRIVGLVKGNLSLLYKEAYRQKLRRGA